ncbi:hypothetical protein ABIB88_008283, partial [Bradyrhizobium sp. JR19.8]
PPIARCSHRAKRRNIRRDSNRYWVTLQGQVTNRTLATILLPTCGSSFGEMRDVVK